MKKNIILLTVFCFALFIFLFSGINTPYAQDANELQRKIAEYEKNIADLQNQANSLTQQISLMDNQIKVNTLKISQTQVQIKTLESDIATLSGKIGRLEGSLNFLSKVLLQRVEETYKSGKADGLTLLLSSRSFADFISRYRYLQVVQMHDRQLLLSMEQTRTSYDEQKALKEKIQTELKILNDKLIVQKKDLASQIEGRKRLLADTKGKESNYQKLLADARSELEAILGILAGKGSEKEIRKVSEGERIASMISDESCNSNGTHLHFMIAKGSETYNPLNYLKNIDFNNCSGLKCGSNDGDIFNPSGNWSWPLSPKIQFNQGYGDTWAIHHTWVGKIYRFHNGIDIVSDQSEIKAAKPGTLYLGSFKANCPKYGNILRYVRVHTDEGNLDTYYLHVNF